MGSPSKKIGRYEVVRELARGGMGVVYLARHAELGREVALKVMRGSAADKGMVQRFIAEAQTVAQLDHPNIVRVHEVGKEGEDPFLVMDLIEGESLEERLKRQGTLTNQEVGEIGRALAEALEHAHERSIVHRDVKPANVLLDPSGRPLLTDFGLAKDLSADKGLTQEGQWVGTPGYMPPEQASGDLRRIDRKSDVYGLGGTLYALLTGSPPFETKTAHETLKAIQETRPKSPRAIRPDVSPDLEAVILKCLEKQPESRYLSARELAEDLGRFLHDRPVLARPATGSERVFRWARRNRAFVASSAAAAILLGLIGIVLLGVFVLPQQRAAGALADHAAFRAGALEPYACGLGEGPAPLAADLEARIASLEEATHGTSREPEAREASELARATLRRVKGGEEAIPRATAGRSTPDLVVDMLLLLERGELSAAKRALSSARRRVGPYAALVELADLELLARGDPRAFLEKASGLEGAAQARAVSLRKVAVGLLFEGQFLAAAQGEGLSSNDRRRLGASLAAAERLGMSEEEVAAAKQAASARCAARWRERLTTALERRTEARLLSFLGAVLREEPRTRPAPELTKVLDDALRRLVADHEERIHETERLERLIDFDHRLTYEVDSRRRGWRSLYLAANRLNHFKREKSETLFRLRHGASPGLAAGGPAQRRVFERLLDGFPESQVAQLWVWRRAQSRARGLEGFEEQLRRLEEILSLETEDVAARYLVQALAGLTRDHVATDPDLAGRLGAFSLRLAAWAEAKDPEDLGSLVACWRFAERLDPEVPSGQIAERLKLLRAAAQDPQDVRARHLLALYLVRGVKGHWRLTEPEVALQVGVEALRLYEQTPPDPLTYPDRIGDQVRCAAFVGEVLRELDRAEEAWQILQPTRSLHDSALRTSDQGRLALYRIVASSTLTEALGEAAYASGRRAAGVALLDKALQVSEGSTSAAFYVDLRNRLEREFAEREEEAERERRQAAEAPAKED